MTAPNMRRAAAFLAGLHAKDRQWLLAQLPMASARVLKPLVEEAMPLVREAQGALDALWSDENEHRPVEVPTPGILIGALDALDEAWAARMIAAAAPDHAEIYLAACAPQRATRIRSELGSLPRAFPEGLSRCMADHLAVMAREVEAISP